MQVPMKNLMDEESISKNQLDHFGLPKPDYYGLCDRVQFPSRTLSCAGSARYFADECRVEAGAGGGTHCADSSAHVHVDRSEECFIESRVATGPDKALPDSSRVSLCCNLEDSPSHWPVVQDLAYSRNNGVKDCVVPLAGQSEAINRFSLKPTSHGTEERSRAFSLGVQNESHERQKIKFDSVFVRESRKRDRDREDTAFFVDVQGNGAMYLSRDEELAGREAMTVKSTTCAGGLVRNCQAQLEDDGGDDLVTHAESKVGRRTRVFAVKKPAAACDPPLEAGIMENGDYGHKCVSTAIPRVSESVLGMHVGERPNQCTSNSVPEPDCTPTGGLKYDVGQEANGYGYSGPRAPNSPDVKSESCEFFGGMRGKSKVRYVVQPKAPVYTAKQSNAVERSSNRVSGDDDLFDSMLRGCEGVVSFTEAALREDAVRINNPLSNCEELGARCSHEVSEHADHSGIESPIVQHVPEFSQQERRKQCTVSKEAPTLVGKSSVVSIDDSAKGEDLGDTGMEENPPNLSAVLGRNLRQGSKASNHDSLPSIADVGKDSGLDNQYVDSGVPQFSEGPVTRDAGTCNTQRETAVDCPEIEEKQGTVEVGKSSYAAEDEVTGIVDHILSEDGEGEELRTEAPCDTDATPGLVEKGSSQFGLTGSEGKHDADMPHTWGARRTRAGTHSWQIPEDVIDLIDDDDNDDEVAADVVGHDDINNDYGDHSSDCNNSASESEDESDATSRKVSGAPQHTSRSEGVGDDNNPSAVPLQPSEDSDDDCQVISQMPPRQQPAGFVARRTVQSHRTGVEGTARKDSKVSSESESDSDCEVLNASQTDIRRQWEEAALRRRMSSALKSEASNVGRGAASDMRSYASRSCHGRNASVPQPVVREREQQSSRHHHGRAESVATSTDTDLAETGEKPSSGEGVPTVFGEIDPQRDKKEPSSSRETGMDETGAGNAVPLEEAESIVELDEVVVGCPTSESLKADAEVVVPALSESSSERDIGDEVCQQTSQVPDSPDFKEACEQECGVAVESLAEGLVDREKLKETDEFRQANNAEWARRKIELERQSSEAQKLKKRKRAEADRRLEVESRQKQRVEEIRQFQQQEEVNLGLKDKLRGKIRGQLEDLAKGCADLATLLRRLGVQMDGGASPSSSQVTAAYKRALLRFHPDRAALPVNGDPQNQVEAEETFKLISRLKSSLPLVAMPSRPAISGRYFNF